MVRRILGQNASLLQPWGAAAAFGSWLGPRKLRARCRNGRADSGNARSMHGNAHSMHRNICSMRRNTRSMHGNECSTYGNACSMYGNTRSMHGNICSIHRNTRSMCGNEYSDLRNECPRGEMPALECRFIPGFVVRPCCYSRSAGAASAVPQFVRCRIVRLCGRIFRRADSFFFEFMLTFSGRKNQTV